MSAFDRLSPALKYHIVNTLGWPDLRPVQKITIDTVLDGRNCVVLAPTAGGKTEAALFPVLTRMRAEPQFRLGIRCRTWPAGEFGDRGSRTPRIGPHRST